MAAPLLLRHAMNLRNLVILLCVVVAVFIAVGIGGVSTNSTPSREQMKEAAALAQIEVAKIEAASSGTAKKQVDWEKLGEFTLNEEKTKIDYAQFLTAKGETAANLIAVFEHSNDERWLIRALELHPRSPIVLMSAIQDFKSATSEQRRAWIDQFKEVDSGNPIPWILSSHEFLAAGKKSEAFAEASAALERPGFYHYISERAAAGSALLEWSGKHALEAELLATVGVRLRLPMSMMKISRALEETRQEEWPTIQAAEASRIQYGMGKILQTPEGARLLIQQLIGINLEKTGIEALPESERPKRLAEIEAFTKSTPGLIEVANTLDESKNEALLAAYLRKLRTEGELSAMRWLQSERAKK